LFIFILFFNIILFKIINILILTSIPYIIDVEKKIKEKEDNEENEDNNNNKIMYCISKYEYNFFSKKIYKNINIYFYLS